MVAESMAESKVEPVPPDRQSDSEAVLAKVAETFEELPVTMAEPIQKGDCRAPRNACRPPSLYTPPIGCRRTATKQ